MTLVSRIPKIIATVKTGVPVVNAASARRIAADAKQRVPKRTGATARTIRAQKATGDDSEAVVGFPGQFIERGTRNIGARPFMVPAAEAERQAHQRALAALWKL